MQGHGHARVLLCCPRPCPALVLAAEGRRLLQATGQAAAAAGGLLVSLEERHGEVGVDLAHLQPLVLLEQRLVAALQGREVLLEQVHGQGQALVLQEEVLLLLLGELGLDHLLLDLALQALLVLLQEHVAPVELLELLVHLQGAPLEEVQILLLGEELGDGLLQLALLALEGLDGLLVVVVLQAAGLALDEGVLVLDLELLVALVVLVDQQLLQRLELLLVAKRHLLRVLEGLLQVAHLLLQ